MTTCWKIGMRFAKWPPKYSTRIIYANLSAFNSKVHSLELYILFQSHLVSAFSSPSTEHQQKKIVAHFWFGFIPLQVFWPLAVIIISLSPIDVASIDIKNQKFDKLFYTLDIECVCVRLCVCVTTNQRFRSFPLPHIVDTKEKNEAFGSSLLLANSPMSPKIVNGSFAGIFDADEFLSKSYAGIRIAVRFYFKYRYSLVYSAYMTFYLMFFFCVCECRVRIHQLCVDVFVVF